MAPFDLYSVEGQSNHYIRVYWSPTKKTLWSPEIVAPNTVNAVPFTAIVDANGVKWWIPDKDHHYLGAFSDKYVPRNHYSSKNNDISFSTAPLCQEAALNDEGVPIPFALHREQQAAIQQRQADLNKNNNILIETLAAINSTLAENTKIIRTFADKTNPSS
jgi:hypothetical protein